MAMSSAPTAEDGPGRSSLVGVATLPRVEPAALQVQEVRLRLGGIVALDRPSFEVGAGEICGLIGPNGAGKTTLFNCVSGLYRPNSGSITLGDNDILALRPDQVADAGIARTFQNIGLFSTQSAVSYTHLDVYKRQGPLRPR